MYVLDNSKENSYSMYLKCNISDTFFKPCYSMRIDNLIHTNRMYINIKIYMRMYINVHRLYIRMI